MEPSILLSHQNTPRLTGMQLKSAKQRVADSEITQRILDALPLAAGVLTESRQFVAFNDALQNYLGMADSDLLAGLRPGEMLGCLNSAKGEGGCGTSRFCLYCGAFRAICESLDSNQRVERECRISSISINKGGLGALDIWVTVKPFIISDERYLLITLSDISEKNRKQSLERIFFHDLLNQASSLKGMVGILNSTKSSEERDYFIRLMDPITDAIIEEIQQQRAVTQAEAGQLEVNKTQTQPYELITAIATQFSNLEIFRNIQVQVDPKSDKAWINSDYSLLRRCIINLVKNALEASRESQVVRIGVRKILDKQDMLEIWVHNEAVLPPEVYHQVFSRNFSTKGSGRGLGTYSVRLLTEEYLSGRVSCTSTEEDGTYFSIHLPLS